MKIRILSLALACVSLPAFANTSYHDLSTSNFSQNWSATDALLTTNDDWSQVPSITGYLGDVDAATTTGVDPRTRTQASSGVVDLVANIGSGVTSTAGGVGEFQSLPDPVVALQGSGTADAPSLVIYLNASGRTNLAISYNVRDIDTTTDNTNQQVAIQYRTNNASTWTSLTPDGYIADASLGPSLTNNTPVSINLSSVTSNAVDNQATLEIRILTTNAPGNDEWTGIDDISITSSPAVAPTPELSIAAASVAEGNTGCVGGTTALNFTVTASTAPASSLSFNFETSDGSATAGSDYTAVVAGTGTINASQTTGTATVQVSCDNRIEANETLTATLTAGAGYTVSVGNGSATGTINNDDVAAIRIGDVSQAEGTGGGTTAFNFTVSLDNAVEAGTGGVGMQYTVDAAGATPATDGVDFLSPVTEPASFSIPVGSNSATLTVLVNADGSDEPNETFAVNLSNPSTGSIADAGGDATITNDDATVPVIAISDVTVTEDDAGGPAVNAVFTVSIVPAPAGTVTVDAVTAGVSAASPGDFTDVSTTLNFDNANTSRTVTVPISNDCTIESVETFAVNLSNVGGTATIGDAQGVGTINDNDVAITASISFLAPSANEGDTGTNTRVARVSLSQAMQCGDFTYSVSNTGGTATAGTDYQAVSVSNQTLSGASTSADVNVTINGDLNSESDETIELTLSGSGTNVTLSPATATATLVNDDTAPVRTIAEIQGDAFQSPFNATVAVVFDKVVTAILPNGFFINDRTPDGLLDTSDAMFVFTSTAPTVQTGDVVNVRGSILEAAVTVPTGQPNYSNLTKFNSTGLIVETVSTGAALPTPFVLDEAMPSPSPAALFCQVAGGTFTGTDFNTTKNFECLEGMRVTTTTGMVNGPVQVFGSDPLAEQAITTSSRRALREAGLTATQGAEDIGVVNPSITPDAPPLPALRFDGNPEGLEIDIDRLGLPFQELVPGTTFTATGILGFEFGGYELFPSSFSINQAAPSRPVAVPDGLADQLTVGSQNALRFYDKCDDPTRANADEVVDVPRVDTKLDKLSRQVREVLRSPDIIAFQEVEQASAPGTVCANGESSNNALKLLADKIAADGGPTYTAFVPSLTNDPGFINNGFLVKESRFSVTNLTQWQPSETWSFNGGAADDLHDRPSLLLEGTTTFGALRSFAIVDNHLRSLSGIDDLSPLADHIDAHRVRQKRLRQAASVACMTQAYQTANPNRPLILVGDFNAFQFSDGYVDVVGIIRGDAQAADSEYNLGFDGVPSIPGCSVSGGQIVAPPLQEAVFALPEDERYSFYFQGIAQELDHGLMNTAASALFEGVKYARGNSEAFSSQETVSGTPLRSSDHDGFVTYFNGGTDSTNNAFGIFKDGFE